jgi:hypothetical protein
VVSTTGGVYVSRRTISPSPVLELQTLSRSTCYRSLYRLRYSSSHVKCEPQWKVFLVSVRNVTEKCVLYNLSLSKEPLLYFQPHVTWEVSLTVYGLEGANYMSPTLLRNCNRTSASTNSNVFTRIQKGDSFNPDRDLAIPN